MAIAESATQWRWAWPARAHPWPFSARNAEQNQLVLMELKAIGNPALVSPLDVTDRAALAPTVAEVERTLGGIDILVNNAGIVALTGGGVERNRRCLG